MMESRPVPKSFRTRLFGLKRANVHAHLRKLKRLEELELAGLQSEIEAALAEKKRLESKLARLGADGANDGLTEEMIALVLNRAKAAAYLLESQAEAAAALEEGRNAYRDEAPRTSLRNNGQRSLKVLPFNQSIVKAEEAQTRAVPEMPDVFAPSAAEPAAEVQPETTSFSIAADLLTDAERAALLGELESPGEALHGEHREADTGTGFWGEEAAVPEPAVSTNAADATTGAQHTPQPTRRPKVAGLGFWGDIAGVLELPLDEPLEEEQSASAAGGRGRAEAAAAVADGPASAKASPASISSAADAASEPAKAPTAAPADAPSAESPAITAEIRAIRTKYILGKIAGEDLYGDRGEMIVRKHAPITESVLEAADREGKLAELIVHMIIPGFEEE